MFDKIVVIEPIVFTKEGYIELKKLCKELICFDNVPKTDDECVKRIGNADCVLTSWQAKITRNVMQQCKNLKYIGMGCSLYDEKFSNIDLSAAREFGIEVKPLKDYGDEGTIEYIVGELISILHGLKGKKWREKVWELNSVKVGIIGLGTIGGMTANALKYFGADVYYYSLHRKPEFEKKGIKYLEKNEMLKLVDIVVVSVNRDSNVLDENAIKILGINKIIINISLGTCYDVKALDNWLKTKNNFYICDNASINDKTKHIIGKENVVYNNLHADILCKQIFVQQIKQ